MKFNNTTGLTSPWFLKFTWFHDDEINSIGFFRPLSDVVRKERIKYSPLELINDPSMLFTDKSNLFVGVQFYYRNVNFVPLQIPEIHSA